jgi:D-arabinose 1-dehydrogenase-like Zn-dependent alcohol dehydrogenase
MRVVLVSRPNGPFEIVERQIPEPGAAIDSEDTLAFSARAGVRSMNETFPLERVSEAYDRMMSGKARFRVVLTIGH